MLDRIKERLGIQITDTSKDNILNELILGAGDLIKSYCNRDDVPDESLVVDMVVIAYRRLGAEGIQGRSIADFSATYYGAVEDLPASITSRLSKYRKLRGWSL